jgi:D-serine deaminase-like pyridoxal phosphate-dependent protein
MTLEEVDTPAILIDLDILDSNLTEMAGRAERTGTRLRPHTKTHKSTWIARQQLAHGASGITVAKLGEAEVMCDAGFEDLLIAYPIVGPTKLERLGRLAERARVTVIADSPDVAAGLAGVGRAMAAPVAVYVEVDSGHHRCGLAPGPAAADLAAWVTDQLGLALAGLMTHPGHVYGAADAADVLRIALAEAEALTRTAEELDRRGLEAGDLSVGSTATAHFLPEVKAAEPRISEVRPGRYVFGDADLVALGAIAEEGCSMDILATVVSRPAIDRMVVDAGSKTFGGDHGVVQGYGRVRGDPTASIVRLSEEHGVIRLPYRSPWAVGDRVRLIPNHCCITANLTDVMVGIRNGVVERLIAVEGRGQTR